ncbi:hypothetical protein ACXZ66_03735 [Corynebacterium sp. S7]
MTTSTNALQQAIVDTLPQTAKIVNTVVKVHGENHPNLAQVKADFSDLAAALNADDAAVAREAQARLRRSAEDFVTPADGCEGYKMMNEQLSALDTAVTSLYDELPHASSRA